ncbi:hypothetical protein CYY_004363 [Polysphondylium violaceum]|uniref:Uncharacterized protein n=1 Tax=Polysphondylium violaceum TaxID=133409 RepID=A0A8J4V5B7_9MYCE|nr:hypothetical protein CYY_004363 [Polysphondylium violaceum]
MYSKEKLSDMTRDDLIKICKKNRIYVSPPTLEKDGIISNIIKHFRRQSRFYTAPETSDAGFSENSVTNFNTTTTETSTTTTSTTDLNNTLSLDQLKTESSPSSKRNNIDNNNNNNILSESFTIGTSTLNTGLFSMSAATSSHRPPLIPVSVALAKRRATLFQRSIDPSSSNPLNSSCLDFSSSVVSSADIAKQYEKTGSLLSRDKQSIIKGIINNNLLLQSTLSSSTITTTTATTPSPLTTSCSVPTSPPQTSGSLPNKTPIKESPIITPSPLSPTPVSPQQMSMSMSMSMDMSPTASVIQNGCNGSGNRLDTTFDRDINMVESAIASLAFSPRKQLFVEKSPKQNQVIDKVQVNQQTHDSSTTFVVEKKDESNLQQQQDNTTQPTQSLSDNILSKPIFTPSIDDRKVSMMAQKKRASLLKIKDIASSKKKSNIQDNKFAESSRPIPKINPHLLGTKSRVLVPPTTTSSKVTALPDFDKAHQEQFDKYESITTYQKKLDQKKREDLWLKLGFTAPPPFVNNPTTTTTTTTETQDNNSESKTTDISTKELETPKSNVTFASSTMFPSVVPINPISSLHAIKTPTKFKLHPVLNNDSTTPIKMELTSSDTTIQPKSPFLSNKSTPSFSTLSSSSSSSITPKKPTTTTSLTPSSTTPSTTTSTLNKTIRTTSTTTTSTSVKTTKPITSTTSTTTKTPISVNNPIKPTLTTATTTSKPLPSYAKPTASSSMMNKNTTTSTTASTTLSKPKLTSTLTRPTVSSSLKSTLKSTTPSTSTSSSTSSSLSSTIKPKPKITTTTTKKTAISNGSQSALANITNTPPKEKKLLPKSSLTADDDDSKTKRRKSIKDTSTVIAGKEKRQLTQKKVSELSKVSIIQKKRMETTPAF